MPSIINVEEYISLKTLCLRLPSRPHLATAYRWATRGIRGIPLPTYLVGGGRMTTLADFDRWVIAISAARGSTASDRGQKNVRTSTNEELAIDRSLDQRGV